MCHLLSDKSSASQYNNNNNNNIDGTAVLSFAWVNILVVLRTMYNVLQKVKIGTAFRRLA